MTLTSVALLIAVVLAVVYLILAVVALARVEESKKPLLKGRWFSSSGGRFMATCTVFRQSRSSGAAR